MAKLFYTLQEAAAKLGKSADEISSLVAAGKLREFRDHEDQLMFKIQEVDLLAGDSGGSMGGLDLSGDFAAASSDSFSLEPDGSAGELNLSEKSASRAAADDGDFTLELDHGDAPASDELMLDSGAPTSKAAGGSEGGLDLDDGGAPAGDELMLDSGAPTSKAAGGSEGGLDLDDGGAPADEELNLDFDEPTGKGVGGSEGGLELDDGPSEKAPDVEPFGLDMDESAASAPSAAASGPGRSSALEEATLELDHGDDPLSSSPIPSTSPLADSLGSIAAAKAASGAGDDLGLEGSNMGATADGSSIADRIGIDGLSSGSGLMDLTNESESSSIGAALMDEAFSSDDAGEIPANASGIFGGSEGGESGAGMAAVGAAAGAAAVGAPAKGKGSAPIFTSGPAAAEAYSGSWSGMGVGLLLPASLALGAAATMVVARTIGAPIDLAVMYAENWTMYTGALAGAIVVSGVIGFFVGKATE